MSDMKVYVKKDKNYRFALKWYITCDACDVHVGEAMIIMRYVTPEGARAGAEKHVKLHQNELRMENEQTQEIPSVVEQGSDQKGPSCSHDSAWWLSPRSAIIGAVPDDSTRTV